MVEGRGGGRVRRYRHFAPLPFAFLDATTTRSETKTAPEVRCVVESRRRGLVTQSDSIRFALLCSVLLCSLPLIF